MNGSSIALGKKDDTVAICSYCSKDVSVANMKYATLTSRTHQKQKGVERSASKQCIKSYHQQLLHL